MRSFIISVFFAIVSAFGTPALAQEATPTLQQQVEVDGVVYNIASTKTLKPGDTIRLGEDCPKVQVDFFHEQKTCTWTKTITVTEAGIEVLPGDTVTTTSLDSVRIATLVSICFMILSIVMLMADMVGGRIIVAVSVTSVALGFALAGTIAEVDILLYLILAFLSFFAYGTFGRGQNSRFFFAIISYLVVVISIILFR